MEQAIEQLSAIAMRPSRPDPVSSMDEARWQAVLARDAAADGSFVFGVLTTGVYCRPSCAARRPLRQNVRFFATPTEAARSGLRACLRCKPDAAGNSNSEVVARICRYLEANAGEKITLKTLAKNVGMSPFHMQRIFKRAMGVSPRQYLEQYRFTNFKAKLPSKSVTDAVYEAGFGSASRVYDSARARLGMSPKEYATGASGELIRYTVISTVLGRVLLAASQSGICAVQFVESEETNSLETQLRGEFRLARFTRDDDGLQRFERAVQDAAKGQRTPSGVPLDIRGTAFQQRVWRQLRNIPAGETRTYSELANEIGAPAAVRAVASACATNRLAVVVPCHRVVHKGGGTPRYRWGADRKLKLLELESK
jgi:AraC family transcriptional regulator, regulatory protein of adaptative response / methylated-DNA-[protein]-cysteine methyltransferase